MTAPSPRSFLPVSALAACALLAAHSASGATYTWNVAPPATGDFMTGSSWSGGVVPTTGDTGSITNSGTAILSAGTATMNELWVGNTTGGTGIGTLEQSGGGLTLNSLIVGRQNGSNGTYTMTGGTVALTNFRVGGGPAGTTAQGTMTVSGVGTTITSSGAGVTGVGVAGTGTLTLHSSAVFTHDSSTAFLVGSDNAVAGANGGTGTLNVNSGAQLNMATGNLAIGRNTNGNGTVVVNGGSITLAGAGTAINLAGVNGTSTGGTAVLTLTSGSVTASTVRIWEGSGTVNLNGGTLTTGSIVSTTPSNVFTLVNFNGGTVRASAASTNFLNGFDASRVEILGGGLVFDTNSHAVTLTQGLDGVGGLTKQGAGTLTLSGANVYTGTTVVNAGTLALGADNAIANTSDLTLNSGTFGLAGFSDTLDVLTLAATSVLDFGAGLGANSLAFSDSSGAVWTGSLVLTNFEVGIDSLSFANVDGLTFGQLSAIQLAGFFATGLDSNGVVQFTAVPEPAEVSLAIAACLGLLAIVRRSRLARAGR